MGSNYSVLSQGDINEIESVLEFANGLILKDTELADSLETTNSYRLSNEFINIRLGLYDVDEETKKKIIDGYTELNSYYKELYDNWGIDYLTSRTAKDLHILLATRPTLSREEMNLFYECYYEVLNYHNKVTSTKAFKNQDMYRGFIKLFLIFSTVQRYLTRKMENFFNIDVYDMRTLKNAFISVGLDYFEDMPINYQRRLLKMINTLLSHKGTNQAILEIINLFGFDNIEIYRYVLAKGYSTDPKTGKLNYNDPYLMFFKTPADKEVDFKKDIILDYNSIVSNDPYWQASEDEVKSIPFNFINSKYMSVDTTIDAMNETIGLAYFMSILNKFQLDYSQKEGIDFGFINGSISENIVKIYDAIVALQSLVIRSHGYRDTISKNPDVINYIYGYRDIENSIDISSIMSEIKEIAIKNASRINNYKEIIEFTENFKMTGFEKEKYSIEDFLEVFNTNEKMRKYLEDMIIETDNYHIYRKLQEIWDIEMRTKISNSIYGDSETFSDYIKTRNYDLYKYIQVPDTIKDSEKLLANFYKDRVFELTESIGNYISDPKVRRYFTNNNFIGLSSYIEKYLYTIISIFKSYTIDLLSANIVFSFDDKTFNTLKLFDDFSATTDHSFASTIDLLDISNILDTNLNIKVPLNIRDVMWWQSQLYKDDSNMVLNDDRIVHTIHSPIEGIGYHDQYKISDIQINQHDIYKLSDRFNYESSLNNNDTMLLKESVKITVSEENQEDKVIYEEV
ncbi:hypothetical protein PBI_PBS1_153 [Bacillus phage PBS1]|uniref:Uncharacterized protein n=1 Tax=Bacillus phage PBS1 TaxID=2884423 RepID=A0A223LD66_BPPB1|nr:virion structural protein [Bacillus phage PBS1]AST99974.1 hypothetical protein PBI_PBS1_153 [Bacillus phage PBS1]BDE75510.1 hypothetical protein [Bacillus phage PBS1]